MRGIFLDTETNGLNPFKHRATEIAFKIVDIETATLLESYESILFQSYEDWQKSDLASLQINGFNWEQVSYGKERETVSSEIQAIFERHHILRGNAVFICQNPSFDRAFFAQIVPPELQEQKLWPYHWLDLASMHWATLIRKQKDIPSLPFPWQVGLSKDTMAQFYGLGTEEKPHRAMNGVNHLLLCYEAIVGFPKKPL